MEDLFDFVCEFGLFFIGGFLFIALLLLPFNYYSTKSEIVEFKSIQSTLENARENKNASPYEIAAIQQKVVDANKWLASNQYWNDTVLGWYIPDEVDDLKPIK
jgi:hypothetical protein